MSKKLTKKEVKSRIEFIVNIDKPNFMEIVIKEMAEKRANEIDERIIKTLAVGIIKRKGIDFCPCCFADIPPKHPLTKYVQTKKVSTRSRR